MLTQHSTHDNLHLPNYGKEQAVGTAVACCQSLESSPSHQPGGLLLGGRICAVPVPQGSLLPVSMTCGSLRPRELMPAAAALPARAPLLPSALRLLYCSTAGLGPSTAGGADRLAGCCIRAAGEWKGSRACRRTAARRHGLPSGYEPAWLSLHSPHQTTAGSKTTSATGGRDKHTWPDSVLSRSLHCSIAAT